jgi:hypothetical protein
VCHKELGVLEMGTMPGVRVHNELRIGNVLRERERVNRRHHDVVMSVYDKSWLFDCFQIGIALSSGLTPLHQGRELALHGLH